MHGGGGGGGGGGNVMPNYSPYHQSGPYPHAQQPMQVSMFDN